MEQQLSHMIETFHRGENIRAFDLLGCHRQTQDGVDGWVFRVWAPKARHVGLIGDFNGWNKQSAPMHKISEGIWECFSASAREGCSYKYFVVGADGREVDKTDPYGFRTTYRPDNCSVVCDLSRHKWHDSLYRANRDRRNILKSPLNIYEMHFGSWRRKENNDPYGYSELAEQLIPYLKEMGYTHVELMPITEYPYDPSWGYQVTGYFAPTSRYGEPYLLMELIDKLHQAGIGVILDWVPAHFPKDAAGLFEFDGACCYELSDPKMNEHPDWTTRIFDYGKPEVISFLISSAIFWLEVYHIDGIRVDAVASMLYLDYNRPNYRPNRFGGRENLEAISFLKKLNEAAFSVRKQPIMVAEESTAFPLITRPTFDGGLGFLFKWNMGWMNDNLRYMSLDPIYRKFNHDKLTFSLTYAFSENYILPLSHDEVVHGKCSLLQKMPGYYVDKFASLRAFFGWQIGHPGKKLNFMGNEFAQFIEWNENQGLDWLLLDYDTHRQMKDFVRDLNHLYLNTPAFWQNDSDWEGFQWISCDDRDNSVIAFRRIDGRGREIIGICNFCPVKRSSYRIGLPQPGAYELVLNSDAKEYGGWDTELFSIFAEESPWGSCGYSAEFVLPPLSVLYYKPKGRSGKKQQAQRPGNKL
ncbi:MAG: 1,4-alpha-glucan branching protein GlgB [Oscillospiraceae bacterium]|nr:1,4-alpha-glucan branching protein GlgB [Oscillospiraceae bacterium]